MNTNERFNIDVGIAVFLFHFQWLCPALVNRSVTEKSRDAPHSKNATPKYLIEKI